MMPLNLALLLVLGSPPHDEEPGTAPLEQAVISASPTAESAHQLAEALTAAEAEALELVQDADALALLDRARLALASIYLALGDSTKAAAAMDEVIRSAMGRDVGAGSFGPTVLELYERRLQALQDTGTSTIAIVCHGCEVIINEAHVTDPATPLYLGSYRVWVVFTDPRRAPTHLEIELSEPGIVARRSFLAVSQSPRDAPEVNSEGTARLLPRWAELTMASAGAVAMISGVVLASLNGKCRGDARGGDSETCPQLYHNRPQDIVLIGLGTTAVVAAGVVLTIDEVRVGRARGHQAMLTWTTRF
ncbi:hypothetical protein DB30_03784 [Enhygromyxa salina]|uniref:PEGA domain-containing protein n=1 Tax=Enhygromyxa salina TaxID=215803 RepID=A0A0C2DBS4_9BACT|nr:hypothetical protein [Enhygromyxa salina]KIG17187.1 hypothetical protein DB30_03784 [Enhygromyxa salina]